MPRVSEVDILDQNATVIIADGMWRFLKVFFDK